MFGWTERVILVWVESGFLLLVLFLRLVLLVLRINRWRQYLYLARGLHIYRCRLKLCLGRLSSRKILLLQENFANLQVFLWLFVRVEL